MLSNQGKYGLKAMMHLASFEGLCLDGSLAPIACASRSAYRRCADCPDEDVCAVRDLMLDVRESITLIMDGTSIKALSARARRDRSRSGKFAETAAEGKTPRMGLEAPQKYAIEKSVNETFEGGALISPRRA